MNNPKLVTAIKGFHTGQAQAQSSLIDMIETVQNEQHNRKEVVACIMEALGKNQLEAEVMYSRMKRVFVDPQTLEDIKELGTRIELNKRVKPKKNV